MHGDDVRRVQFHLKSNRWHNFLDPQAKPGVYGPRTASSTHNCKYWLGFPRRYINGSYGRSLHRYLLGAPLPLAYRIRRRRRLAANVTTQRTRAYRMALSQKGVKEFPPDSNLVKYSLWYGIRGAWCAMFVTWCFVQVGNTRTFRKGSRYAFVPFLLSDARQNRNGLSVTLNPIRGDLVCYDWNHDRTPDHIGIFESWTNRPQGEFSAIEGNTAIGNDSNGGEVMRRFRNRGQVADFVRVHTG